MNNKKSISIIGAGHLGSALVKGLIKSGYPKEFISISNRNPDKLNRLSNELGVLAAPTNSNAVANANILVLAVKPQAMQELCIEIAAIVAKERPLIISLAAVTHLEDIARWLGADDLEIVRVMTNTPMEFCKGVSALFANGSVTEEHKKMVTTLFEAVGSTFWVKKEQLLDPLTAAIGSAPAYVLLFMEALQKAAMSQKIPEKIAEKIACDVVAGTALLAEQSERSFADLRRGVTTPSGITEHSLRELSIEGFFDMFENVYSAASERIEQIKGN